MGAFFVVFVGPVSAAPPGKTAGGAALTRPTKDQIHRIQTKKKTSFDVFFLEYWYRGWDSNPQARQGTTTSR